MPDAPLPPGRRGLPWIGESLAFMWDSHRFYLKRAQRHGPVFKTRLLGRDTAVFSGDSALAFLAAQGAVRHRSSPFWVHNILGDCLPFADGADHAARKAIVLDAFKPEALAGYLALIEPVVARHIDRWRTAGEVAWLPLHRALSVELAATLLTTESSPEHLAAVDRSCGRMEVGFLAPPIRLPWTRYGKALAGRDQLLAFADAAIRKRRAAPTGDVISRLVHARDADGNALSDAHLRAEALHLIFAAQTGFMFATMLFGMGLGQHPELVGGLRDEVRAHAPTGPLSLATLAQMPRLTATTFEVRRRYPGNAATQFANTPQDLAFGGFRIPAGWRVIGALHATSVDPATFPQPERLDPERFAGGCPMGYAAHGVGPHRCGGEGLVTLLMQVAGVHMLRRLDWTLVDPDAGLGRELFPLPKDDLRVRFAPFDLQKT